MSTPGLNPDQREFRCVHCNGKIVVPKDLPPTAGPCPHCEKEITSPGPEIDLAVDPIFGKRIDPEAVPLPAGPPPLEAKSSPYQPPGAPPAPMPPAAGPPEGSGRSTASLVLGILGVFFSCIPCIGLILGILAVVYGGQVIDSARVRYELQPYVGTARAGKILGIVTIVLSVLATVSSFVSNRS